MFDVVIYWGGSNPISIRGGIGRHARLCFHHLGQFIIVDYEFPVLIYED